MVQEYFTTGKACFSGGSILYMPHVVSGCKNMFFTPFVVCMVLSAISEVDGIKLQNFPEVLSCYRLDFDIFNLLVVSGRLKLQENL